METTSVMALGNSSEFSNITTEVTPFSDSLSPASDWSNTQHNFYLAEYVVTPTILLVGLFGNTMTVLTLSSKAFSNLTLRFILIAISLSDTTLIVLQPFNKLFVRELIGYDARALSAGGCKFFFWLFRTAKMTSSWFIVILCFERFVAVVFPLKTRSIINKTNILMMIVSDYVLIGIYNGFWTFSSIIVDGICKPDVVYPDTELKYLRFLLAGLSLYYFIPLIVMVVFTPIIIWKMLHQTNGHPTQQAIDIISTKDVTEIRASMVLAVIVAAFIMFVLPITLVFSLAYAQHVSPFETNSYGFFIFREVAQILELFNYSINFFLYIMCSEMFRRRTLQILRRPCKRSSMSLSEGASDNLPTIQGTNLTKMGTNMDISSSQNPVRGDKTNNPIATMSL